MKNSLWIMLFMTFTVFGASPLHRRALGLLETRKKLSQTKSVSYIEKNPKSPLAHVSLATTNETKRSSLAPNDNQCLIKKSGVLGMFNGPWAKAAREICEEWITKEGPIETKEAIGAVASFIQSKVKNLDKGDVTTAGAIVAVTSARRLLWGCFSGGYVLAVKKNEGEAQFIFKPDVDKENGIIAEEFDQNLTAQDIIVVSSFDMVSLLHLMRRECVSKKTLQDAYDVFGGLIDSFALSDQAAVKIMQEGKSLVERVEKAKMLYPPRTTLVVAKIKDRSNEFGSLEDE